MEARRKQPELRVLGLEAARPFLDPPLPQQDRLPACRERGADDGPLFEGDAVNRFHALHARGE
jgi:hypothetical protein